MLAYIRTNMAAGGAAFIPALLHVNMHSLFIGSRWPSDPASQLAVNNFNYCIIA